MTHSLFLSRRSIVALVVDASKYTEERHEYAVQRWLDAVGARLGGEVEVTVVGEAKASALEREEPEPAVPQVSVPPRATNASLQALLESGDMADIELKCGGASVSAHKLILSARSPVFAAMFGRGMAEAEASEVTLEGIEPAVLRSLVHFLYAEELDDSAMEHPRQLLAAADQYEVPRLVALCEEQLCEGIDEASAAARLVLAERHHAAQLKEACLDYIAAHSEAVMKSEGWQQLGTRRAAVASRR